MGGSGLAARFKALCEENQRSRDQGDDADDMEAIHESKELSLGMELIVDAGVRGVESVGGGEAVGLQIARGLVDVLLQVG